MSLGEAYVAFVIVILVLGAIAISLPIVPTRQCHMCEARVQITARRCRHCGYDFAHYVVRR